MSNTIAGSEVHCHFLFTDELFLSQHKEKFAKFLIIFYQTPEAMPFGGTLSISVEIVTENLKRRTNSSKGIMCEFCWKTPVLVFQKIN